MRVFLPALVLYLGVVVSAAAQPLPMPPELTAFLMQPAEQNIVKGSAARQWADIVDNCPSPRLLRSNVLIEVPPKFDLTGTPVSGVWRVISHVGGCGNEKVISLLYFFSRDGHLQRTTMLPGGSGADLTLQHDALMYAIMGMQKLAPAGCQDIHYLDTSDPVFGEMMPNARPGREAHAWTEIWTVKACGVKGNVTMHFVPDATGTTIMSNPDETQPLD